MPLINLATQFEMCSLFAAFSSCAAAKTSQKAYFPVVELQGTNKRKRKFKQIDAARRSMQVILEVL